MAATKTGKTGRSAKRAAVIELADELFGERLDTPPDAAPTGRESTHDKARRALIREPGQWVVLNARVKLSEAAARRMARSYQRAKPARLVPTATGRFAARPFVRDETWLVAAVYEPAAARQE
ncbi:MAG: hypothetical protein M3N95_09235 [Actinomycetota bacterium]|nr:hypothetical protein [Actinomycetota bacterium]